MSFVVEINPDVPTPTNQSIGVDLGLKTFATLSEGTLFKSPDYSLADRKIRKLQRQLARQQKDSKRRNKTRIKLDRQHNKIAIVEPMILFLSQLNGNICSRRSGRC